MPVKGLAEPVEVYELAGAGAARSRLQAAAARGLTRFVGRDAELEQLREALGARRAGHGQVVAVVGEPGVGKSRLVWEVTHSHRTHGWLVLEAGSVSYGKATAYLPVIDLLRGYFAIEEPRRPADDPGEGHGEAPDARPRRSEPAAARVPGAPGRAGGRRAVGRPSIRPSAGSGPSTRSSGCCCARARSSRCWWSSRISTGSTPRPRPCSTASSRACPTARLLLLVNYRPEYRHGWGGKTYYRQLRLDPLPPESADELLEALLGATRPSGRSSGS